LAIRDIVQIIFSWLVPLLGPELGFIMWLTMREAIFLRGGVGVLLAKVALLAIVASNFVEKNALCNALNPGAFNLKTAIKPYSECLRLESKRFFQKIGLTLGGLLLSPKFLHITPANLFIFKKLSR
jgi:hypothetical protein